MEYIGFFFPQRNVESSGVIPQISMIMGPCAGRSEIFSPSHLLYKDGLNADLTKSIFIKLYNFHPNL